jgi:CRP-like cAMP-binding protein
MMTERTAKLRLGRTGVSVAQDGGPPPLSLRPGKNRLLGALPRPEFELLESHLEFVRLTYRRSLYAANKPIDFVYFVDTGVCSLVNTMRNGSASEVGTIGNEGLVGLPVVLGDKQAPTTVYVQVPGIGTRMRASVFWSAMEESPTLRRSMLHYAHAFFNQVAQSAACNTFHSLDQRCCRWLLMTHDRVDTDEFLLTHEFLAMMLGVRRAGVTEAAGALQRDGLIRYKRGLVTILDKKALLKRSCECYAVAKEEFDRLLGTEDRPSHPGSGVACRGFRTPEIIVCRALTVSSCDPGGLGCTARICFKPQSSRGADHDGWTGRPPLAP